MKKRKKVLFSLLSFLFVLLILGQQEIKKKQRLFKDLDQKEINNFIFTTHDFVNSVREKSDPFIFFVNTRKIEALLITKCRLGENIFLREISGQEIVLNSYGDAGIIQFELARGGKIISANPELETNYFKKEALPSFRELGFSSWEIILYFLKKIFLISLFTLIPFLFSFKLLIISLGVIIISLIIISIQKNTKTEKLKFKTAIEYCLKKIPPNLEKKTCFYNYKSLDRELLIADLLILLILESTRLLLMINNSEKAVKITNKIFHVPKFSFVEN